jgi:hypothetical protein
MPIYVRDNRGGNWFWLHNAVVDHYGKQLGPYGIAVYVCLCRHVGQEQATWVGQREIAEEMGMSRRQVQRELEQLQTLALVSVETQETPHGQATNIYTLLAPPTSGRRALSIHEKDPWNKRIHTAEERGFDTGEWEHRPRWRAHQWRCQHSTG